MAQLQKSASFYHVVYQTELILLPKMHPFSPHMWKVPTKLFILLLLHQVEPLKQFCQKFFKSCYTCHPFDTFRPDRSSF